LVSIVEQCLAFELRERPESAMHVARALRRSQGVRARAARWLLRRRVRVAVACLLIFTVGSAAIYHRSLQPPADAAHARLGYDAFAQGDFQLAVHHFTESLRAKSNQPEVLFARGRGYLRLAPTDNSNYSLAGIDFTHAEQRAVEERFKGRSMAFLAYSAQKQGQFPEAIHLYQEAMRKGFRPAEAYNNLARLHLDRAELLDAQRNLDLALGIKSDLGVAHHNQAFLYYQKALQVEHRAQKDLLEKAIHHFHKAGDARTATMTLMGASLCASASVFDEAWTAHALKYLQEAIDQGMEPSKWLTKQPFTIMENMPGYQALFSRRPLPNHPSTAPVWIVEPAME
jgi:tetratricopeptide (TPR) repeat protein